MSNIIDLGPVTAYALARKHGFQGTEAEWLASLKGDPATDATVPDGSITEAKLAQDVKDKFRSLSEEKVSLPKDATGATQNGTNVQILQTNGDGTTQWVDKPKGGSALTITNTAAVGQTVKITAVDENGHPTEWEAVDMASGGGAEKRVRHIATVSVTAGTTSYSVTVDSNGGALNLESVYILTKKFWGNNGSYVQVKINGKDITRAYGASGSPQALELEKMGELQKLTNIQKPSDVVISFGDYYNGKSAVTSVGFWSTASTVDTTIEIYGVDA